MVDPADNPEAGSVELSQLRAIMRLASFAKPTFAHVAAACAFPDPMSELADAPSVTDRGVCYGPCIRLDSLTNVALARADVCGRR